MPLKIYCKNYVHISFLQKKKWQLICGNDIAEIEGGKICGKRQKRIFEIDLGMISIGGFIGNDQ